MTGRRAISRADFFAGRGPDARWVGSITPAYEPPVLRGNFPLAEAGGEHYSGFFGAPYIVTDFLDEVEGIMEGHAEEWVDFRDLVQMWVPGDSDRPVAPDGPVWAYCFDAGAVYVHQDGYLIEVLYPNGSRKRAELPDVTKESGDGQPAEG